MYNKYNRSSYQISGLHPTVGRNCLLSSIKDLLAYYKIEVKESELYFICNGLRFAYDAASTKKNLSDRFVYDISHHITSNLSLYFPYTFIYKDSFSHQKIVTKLCNQTPFILMIKPHAIPYNHRVFQPVGRQEMHSVIVYGYDDNRQMYHVADSTMVGDDGIFISIKEQIPYNILAHNALGYIYVGSADQKFQQMPVGECIFQSLDEFLHPVEGKEIIYGYQAINQVLQYIRETGQENIKELQFLIQAYFMPLFYYLDEMLIGYGEIAHKLNLEKNKWNMFFYKYLMRLQASWSVGKVIHTLEANLNDLIILLHDILKTRSKY